MLVGQPRPARQILILLLHAPYPLGHSASIATKGKISVTEKDDSRAESSAWREAESLPFLHHYDTNRSRKNDSFPRLFGCGESANASPKPNLVRSGANSARFPPQSGPICSAMQQPGTGEAKMEHWTNGGTDNQDALLARMMPLEEDMKMIASSLRIEPPGATAREGGADAKDHRRAAAARARLRCRALRGQHSAPVAVKQVRRCNREHASWLGGPGAQGGFGIGAPLPGLYREETEQPWVADRTP